MENPDVRVWLNPSVPIPIQERNGNSSQEVRNKYYPRVVVDGKFTS
jgi:hypothetical protein